MKRLAFFFALVVAAVALPGVAHGAVPCRDRIYNDWYADGKIDTTYPIACYKDALKHVPADARVYSSLSDDITSAMQGAIARLHGKKNVPAQIGHGEVAGAAGVSHTVNLKSTTTTSGKTPAPGNENAVASAPVADTSSSGGLPLPIIVLGAVAILLAAAGAAGAGFRHFRGRRPS